ncbi:MULTISPECIES: host attachment family protein [unclassified Sphingomonas]|jgi:protein required for attachment to host cells|uniref:host attachment family protein n=1 Tax=unclassified Sphingomonas TaxID=196159 RepID=UPI000829871C|nr:MULTISPECIES: host attachment family protein [unclassified Sphingomonas]MCH4892817.1 Host attachment protein [Sphingomonas sp. SFZ2018-12]
MQIAHDALVLVADGRKMLWLRNEGDAVHPNLVVEDKQVQPNPKDSEQKTDAPGRTFSSLGGGGPGGSQSGADGPRSSMEETDFHQQAEDRFAAEAAETLRMGALANQYEQLIIVAPPRTLGEMRKHYHKEVEARLAGELAKDLTDHPIPEIERLLIAA